METVPPEKARLLLKINVYITYILYHHNIYKESIYRIYMVKKEKKEKEFHLANIIEFPLQINVEEVLEREIKAFGSGAHIIVPQKHEGKKAKIIIEEKEEKT